MASTEYSPRVKTRAPADCPQPLASPVCSVFLIPTPLSAPPQADFSENLGVEVVSSHRRPNARPPRSSRVGYSTSSLFEGCRSHRCLDCSSSYTRPPTAPTVRDSSPAKCTTLAIRVWPVISCRLDDREWLLRPRPKPVSRTSPSKCSVTLPPARSRHQAIARRVGSCPAIA